MNEQDAHLAQDSLERLRRWLRSCTRKGKIARNTVAVGMVVLDRLRETCPVSGEEAFTAGGELKGARSGLAAVLEKYGVPGAYLKEATTRQSHQDARRLLDELEWGNGLSRMSSSGRDEAIRGMI
ncbi:MAG: hypothetical protein IT323_07435, partial [Anaerolineae bacterium]|nr:hypothetical protein [Anaerolineae bacterium]